MDGDEWAKMFEYHIRVGHEKDKLEMEQLKSKQRAMKETLDMQVRDRLTVSCFAVMRVSR